MTNDATFEKIEAWLSGELPEAEARAFEAAIAADAALGAEVARHRRGREALDRLAEQALQVDMARWRETMNELPAPPTDASPGKGPARWAIVGVLALLVLGALYWIWPSKEAPPTQSPAQEKLPTTQPPPNIPIAITPADQPVNKNPDTKQTEANNAAQLIVMAETNLGDFQGAVLQQYTQTMGDDDGENPHFTEGVKAFKQNALKAAKKELLQVPETDPFFPSAQEMLATIYLSEKNYPKARQSYASFARQSADPVADWRLLQFYLADYQNSKAAFWKKLAAIAAPANDHRFQKDAEKLRDELGKMGVTDKE